MFFEGSKFREQFLKKGHTRNDLVKLFQILTSGFGEKDFLRISPCPYSAKSLAPHGGHVFRRIKISRTILEEGHPRNNPVKLFQNLKSGFRGEDVRRIPHSNPSSTAAIFFDGSKFRQPILKRVKQGTIL